MINLSMWGFESAGGFGASTPDTVGAEPAGDGAGAAPQDLTFGAHLAESLFGVAEEEAEGDTDEEWPPLVPAAFVLTSPMREPVSRAQETAAPFSEAVDGEAEFRADGEAPVEAATNAIQDVPVEAGIPVVSKQAPDVPAETETSARTEAGPPSLPDAKKSVELPATAGAPAEAATLGPTQTQSEARREPEVRIEQPQAEHQPPEHRPAEHRQTEHRQTEHREAERHVELTDALPKRAVERTAVKNMGTPVPQIDAVPAREIAPGERIESSLPAEDSSPAPRMAQPQASLPDERGPGDRQPRDRQPGERRRVERQDPQLPDLRVQQTTVEPVVEAAKPFMEAPAPQVTAPEPVPAVAESAPRLVLHSTPVQPQAIAADVEIASAPPETRGPMPRETAESIIQSLRLQYQRGGGEAVVHIKPEHLGPVSVSLRVENGSVSAVVNAENPAVAEWLKANEHLLRDGLSSNGLHLERFAIRRDGHPHDDGRKGWRPPDERERRRRALKPESTFEITV
jgi:flagellar hook-length control protein FliK